MSIRLLILLPILFLFLKANSENIVPLIKEGDPAPTFMLPTLDDKRVSLRDYCGVIRNQWKNNKRYIVIVSFMASYCVPCRHEIPLLEAYAKTAEEDVKVIFISVDTIGAEQLAPFVQKMNITQTLLVDRYGGIMKKYGVQKLPSLFIIDKDGYLRFQNLNGLPADVDLKEMLSKKVAQIRAQSAASANIVTAIPVDKKKAILKSILSSKSAEEIAREQGLTQEDAGRVKDEIDVIVKERWSAEQ